MTQSPTAATLGVLGLPRPLAELCATPYDVIVVGGGHNGLTCAAYLARAGKRVLVLEAQDRVGGAATVREPFPGYRLSPCAYLCGLLHPKVIEELQLADYGFRWTPADAGMFVPFEDGSSVQLWEDEAACEAEIAALSPADVPGWRAMQAVKTRARDALRPNDERDLWLGPPPSREQVAARLKGDEEALGLIFDWSMAEYAERYLRDPRLQIATLGQGVIGTNASPMDPGTAFIHFMHSCGRMQGMAGTWGYVHGGIGMVSFSLCDAARAAGAEVATGVPVARILPGEGVELAGGDVIRAPVVVSNADPRATLTLLGENADGDFRARVEAWPQEGCTVKLNVALRELPDFLARPGTDQPHHRGQINTPLSKADWQASFAAARAGQLPERMWTELYFQSSTDQSLAPPGRQVMSIFAQYVPYNFVEGDWDHHREAAGQVAIHSVARFCSNLPDVIEAVEIKGPPDIEATVGLTGGHIFQGSCLPPYMWEGRFDHRTPMAGMYLCGACTHPAGSVIAVNGRNAAMAVLADG